MSPAIIVCCACGDAFWADRKHNCAGECQQCDGEGRIWNNADPTSGQWHECECALAPAARQGGDAQQAPGEAPQSGGEAASPNLYHHPGVSNMADAITDAMIEAGKAAYRDWVKGCSPRDPADLAERVHAAMEAARQPQLPSDDGLIKALEKARDLLREAPLESGVCCCGDKVEHHNIGSGHSPVDELQYHASNLAEEIDEALSRHKAPLSVTENDDDLSRTGPRPDDLLLRSEVVALCHRKADDLAGLVLEAVEDGFPKSARKREAMEATATKLRHAIAQMPAAPLSVAGDDVERAIARIEQDLEAARREGLTTNTLFNIADVRTLLTALQVTEGDKLQPVETAPKDGSYFLFVGSNFDGGAAVVHWDTDFDWWQLDDGKNPEIALRHESKLIGWLPLPAAIAAALHSKQEGEG